MSTTAHCRIPHEAHYDMMFSQYKASCYSLYGYATMQPDKLLPTFKSTLPSHFCNTNEGSMSLMNVYQPAWHQNHKDHHTETTIQSTASHHTLTLTESVYTQEQNFSIYLGITHPTLCHILVMEDKLGWTQLSLLHSKHTDINTLQLTYEQPPSDLLHMNEHTQTIQYHA
jgi:hypothetical protein